MTTPRHVPLAVRCLASVVAVSLIIAAIPTPGAARSRLARQMSERGNTPHVIYSTLLGGAEGNFDGAADVAVDSAGNAIVVGQTESSDFPTRNALRDSLEGSQDGFVAKFDPTGALIFSTFLGGDESDSIAAVAVDSTGAIYVAGSTSSPDFPIKNAAQSTPGGVSDAFVTKLSADGSEIIYSTRLGGNGIDSVRDMAVDTAGRAYVTGEVIPVSGGTATFPSVNAAQAGYGGGASDGFVSVVSEQGNSLLYSTLFDGGVQGGATRFGRELVSSILVDSDTGSVYLGGYVEFDENEPETPFACALQVPSGRAVKAREPQLVLIMLFLLYTLNPGNFSEGAKILLNFLIGFGSSDYERRAPGGVPPNVVGVITGYCPVPPSNGGCERPASIVALDRQLQLRGDANLALLQEFFFDTGTLDRQSAVYIAGDISSDRLTRVNAFQPAFGGNDDVVVAVLEPGTLNKAMVSFFGGDGYDDPASIATDADGNIYVCGLTTLSTTFPTTPGALQSTPKGRNDAFLVKISPVGPFAEAPDFSLSFDPATVQVQRGTKVSVTLAIDRVGGFDGNVKVKPPAQVAGFKSPKKQSTVTGNSLVLKFKIKSDAPSGPTSFTFTGTDKDGRSRSATVTLDVQ